MKLNGKEAGAKQIKEIESEGWETQAEHRVKDRTNEIQGMCAVQCSDGATGEDQEAGAGSVLWSMYCKSQLLCSLQVHQAKRKYRQHGRLSLWTLLIFFSPRRKSHVI